MFPPRASWTRALAAFCAVLALSAALGAPAAARAEDAAALRRALAAAAAKDWTAAEAAARASGPLARDITAWQRLRAGRGSLADYAGFAARNADWPGMDLLRERAEAAMGPATPSAEVIAWFGADGVPRTSNGLVRLVAALAAAEGREAAARRLAVLWAAGETPLDAATEAALLAEWGPALQPLHGARARALLDRKETEAARRLVPRLAGDEALLAQLRIDLQAEGPDLDARIRALPPRLAADPGLALDRFRRFAAARDVERARAIMLAQSSSAEALVDPAAWSRLRADYARAALRAGDAATALKLAFPHHLPADHPDALDLDFLAGFAAFKLGDWTAARGHFERLRGDSSSAITQSRALYWLARTAEAAGDRQAADDLMARAATHQSAWYGQLAAEAVGAAMDPALARPEPGLEALPDWRGAAIREDRRVQAAIWLFVAGEPDLAQRFLVQAAADASGEDTARLARLMAEFRQTHHALRLAKLAAQKGTVLPTLHFPLTGLERDALGVPPELAMAIARQESEFNPHAGSSAGARGLMQVMPATAQHIAPEVGLPYDLHRLSTDPDYNALYGATYLAGLRERYGPSIALVAAGYNAGPGRSAQWLKAFGDLRQGADPVEWVETIPFDETRNYVMRVAEALPVYRARIAGSPVPFTPTEDLTGGGVLSVPIPRPVLTLAASLRPPARPGGAVSAPAPAVAPAPAPAQVAVADEPAPARPYALGDPADGGGALPSGPTIPPPPLRE